MAANREHAAQRFTKICLLNLFFATVAFATVDFEQVRRLRRQGLFRAAERKCLDLLDTDLIDSDRALVLVEYFRTAEAHMSTVSANERLALIDQSRQNHDAYVKKHADSPYGYLVAIQFAIARSTNARLARFDAEANLSADGFDTAIILCRDVIRDLEDLDKQIGESMRAANRARSTSAFSQTQYQRLSNTVSWEIARSWVNLAKCFPNSKQDQISLLAKAAEQTASLSRLTSNPTIATKAMLLDAECQRHLGNSDRCHQILAILVSDTSLDDCVRLAAVSQQIWLYMGSDEFTTAQNAVEHSKALKCSDRQTRAEHAYATLNLFVELAIRTDNSEDSWRLRSEQQARIIAREFPGYWQRRSDVVFARLRGGAAVASELAQLETSAASFFARGEFDKAVKAYEQAERIAANQELADRVFEFRYRAGAILHQQQQFAAAVPKLRQAAIDGKDESSASKAHLLAIVDAAQLARSGSADNVDQYAELLDEHLSVWPNSSDTKDQAAWWLGQLRQRQGKRTEAIKAFVRITVEFNDYKQVIDAMRDCYKGEVESTDDLRPRPDVIQNAVANLESISARLPIDSDLRTWAELSAIDLQLLRSTQTASSERRLLEILQSTTNQVDRLAATKANELLVVCYAAQSRPPQARQCVKGLAELDADQVRQLMRRLAPILDSSTRRRELAQLQLDLFDLQDENGNVPDDIQGLRAKSLAEIGNYGEAIDALQQQLERQSNSIAIRTELANAFEQAQQPNEALDEWRKLAANSKPASEPWFKAKYGIAKNLLTVKKPNEAADVIRVTRALHPELGGFELKRLFESLLRLCEADASQS